MKRPLTAALIGFTILFLTAGSPVGAADVPDRPTFAKDVAPILQENCQACHRPAGMQVSGMIAPMSLVTYAEVRPWARSLAKSVQTKTMPPWYASERHHGEFKTERSLTTDEIATIVRWVGAGSARGDPADAPPPMSWPDTGWTINGGRPDVVVGFDEPYWVSDDVDDLYQNISIQLSEELVPEDRWLKAIEFKPGSEVVHHIIAFQSAPGGSGAMTAGMLGGEAPGTDPSVLPEGYGMLVRKGAAITFQMHYHKEKGPGTGVWDSSEFAMVFHDKNKPVAHQVRVTSIDHGAFEIPPGHGRWRVGGAQTFSRGITILSYMPHLHLRGVACRYTAYHPDGTSEVLLDIPAYNFNWQISYEYKDNGLKRLPAGTRVEFEMWYDNSAGRAAAVGYNHARSVAFGGPTWDEMDLGFLNFAYTEETQVPSAGGE